MTITANGDTVNYDRGGVKSTAEIVVSVNSDGSPIGGTNASPQVQRDALLTSSDLSAAVINISTATTTPIVAAVSGQTTRVHRLRLNAAAAQSITVKDGATTLEVINFTGAGFLTYDFSSRPWYKTTANTALNFTTTTTGQVNGVLEYVTSA